MASHRPSENGKTDAGYLKQFGGLNAGYVAELIERYESDPASVPMEDQAILAHGIGQLLRSSSTGSSIPAFSPASHSAGIRDLRGLQAYIYAIRNFGYRAANLDPLGMRSTYDPLLDPATHGVTDAALSAPASEVIDLLGEQNPLGLGATAGDLISKLRGVYCGTAGYEFAHVRGVEERTWLQQAVETGLHRSFITDQQKRNLLELLTRTEAFEQFLHRTFPGQRWYSLEGSDAFILLLDQIVLQSAYTSLKNIVVGMAHRGRLNVLAHIFGKPYGTILSEFSEGHFEQLAAIDSSALMTDVKYHMGARINRDVNGDGAADIALVLLPNPSHLELVNPVVVGAVRALQDRAANGDRESEAMGVIVHGDAAFAGQGIVAETLNLAGLPGYSTGGTIHVIVNNQLGFTTEPEEGYSTEHASDLARGFDVPIVHVNGDDVEACVAAAKLAVAYRQRFHKDFLIDLVGYRRFGHNENDEPSFTQPLMYNRIAEHPTVRSIWASTLAAEEVVSSDDADRMVADSFDLLQREADSALGDDKEIVQPTVDAGNGNGNGGPDYGDIQTSVPSEDLRRLNELLATPPEGFGIHPRVARVIQRRREALDDGGRFDWAHAESLAFGAILSDGRAVRLTGQDTQRGTFSQRHAVLHDYKTGDRWVPLKDFGGEAFSVYNSPLSEIGAMGFEHGYSVTAQEALVLWEAQFGDFVNNAQGIVDELVVSARAKWDQRSGLVLLLPHGYEGQGPNHSHAHLERFLALAARGNIRVSYPTTAAQYFHLLRRQAASLSHDPRPLIVMTAKSLLRHPLAAAQVDDLTDGKFEPLIRYEKPNTRPSSVRRLVLCTGKVFVDVVTSDAFEQAKGVSILRFEDLYPFPKERLAEEVARLTKLEEVVWLQEEPRNRGAWAFVDPLLREVLGPDRPIRYIGRQATPSPAEGAQWLHKNQQNRLVEKALGSE